MGGFRAAGDLGFLFGVSAAGFLVDLLVSGASTEEANTAYASIFAGFGAIHLAVTAIAVPILARSSASKT